MSVAVRRATPDDAAVLLELEEASFRTDRISPRQMGYLLRQGKALTLVAEENGPVVGYGMLFTPLSPRPARLYSLAVRADRRGAGIGSQLIEALVGEAERLGYRRVRLEVRATDRATRALYTRHGFDELAALPGYYADGEDGLRLERTLR